MEAEKGVGLGHILKAKPTEFSDGLEVGQRGEVSQSQLRDWQGGFSICWDGEGCVGEALREWGSGHVEPRKSPGYLYLHVFWGWGLTFVSQWSLDGMETMCPDEIARETEGLGRQAWVLWLRLLRWDRTGGQGARWGSFYQLFLSRIFFPLLFQMIALYDVTKVSLKMGHVLGKADDFMEPEETTSSLMAFPAGKGDVLGPQLTGPCPMLAAANHPCTLIFHYRWKPLVIENAVSFLGNRIW